LLLSVVDVAPFEPSKGSRSFTFGKCTSPTVVDPSAGFNCPSLNFDKAIFF